MAGILLGDDIYGDDIVGDEMGIEELLGALYGDDIVGDDMVGMSDLLGTDWRRRAGRGGGNPAKRAKALQMLAKMNRGGMRVRSAPPLLNRIPGVGAPSQVTIPLGFPVVQFTNLSGTVLQAQAQPQVPVQGGRITVVRRDATATAAAANVRLINLLVGQQSIFASADGIAVETLGPLATDTVLQLPSAQPGILITAQFAISPAPPAAPDVTTLNIAAFCKSIAG